MSAEVIHGECLDVLAGMEARSVDAIVTDPPYLNTGTGTSRVSRVAAIPDERQFFDLWMREHWREFARVLKPTGGLWMTIDWRGAVSCERAANASDLTFGGVGVWAKSGLGMGFMLRHTYECFVVARMPAWQRRNASESDVWSCDWSPSHRKTGHEAEKPVELVRRAIRMLTRPGSVVLDPFAGSGTTGVAAGYEACSFIGIEREAPFAEMARARITEHARCQQQDLEGVA